MTDSTFDTEAGGVTGKLAFIVSFVFSAVNVAGFFLTTDFSTEIHITTMDIVSAIIMIFSAVFGIPYAYYKLRIAHHDYVERKEQRKKNGDEPIKFRWNLLSWLKKQKNKKSK